MQQEINNSICNKETEKKFTLLLRFSIYIYSYIYFFSFIIVDREWISDIDIWYIDLRETWQNLELNKNFGTSLKHRYENDRRKKLFLDISLNISLIFDWWVSLRYLVSKKRSFWTFLKKSRIPLKNFIIYFWNILLLKNIIQKIII